MTRRLLFTQEFPLKLLNVCHASVISFMVPFHSNDFSQFLFKCLRVAGGIHPFSECYGFSISSEGGGGSFYIRLKTKGGWLL